MPKIRPGMAKPPSGFEKISDALDDYDDAMRDAVAASTEGRRRAEATWEVSSLNRQRTRYVYSQFRGGHVSKAVLDYCGKYGFVDAGLVRLWGLPGYESACCVECVQPKNSNFGGSCVCRVPPKDRVDDGVKCSRCGCSGCCSGERKKPAGPKPVAGDDAKEPAAATDAGLSTKKTLDE